MTGGFLGMGTLFDMLFLIPQMVDQENRRLAGKLEHPQLAASSFVQPMANPFFFMDDPVRTESAEKQILKAAERGGTLTVQMMALDTDLSLEEASGMAEFMRKEGHCELDIAEDGAEVYTFIGLSQSPWCWITRASSRLVFKPAASQDQLTRMMETFQHRYNEWRLCRFGSRTAA